jgi:hypothetical protein
MKKIFILCTLIFSFVALAEDQATVFVTLSPAGSFSAVSKKVKGNLVRSGDTFISDKLSVTIESFKTGIDLRDEHFWKHLNASKCSKATLSDLSATGGKATANLEVNCVKKPVSMTYLVKGSEVVATFMVKASDFGLSKAEYLGVGVDNSVKIETTMGYKNK